MKKIILSVMCLYAVNVFASQEVDVDFSQPKVKNQISIGQSVAVSLANGSWVVNGDRAVWSYEFNTPNATSMSFSASADLPAGSVVHAGNSNLTRTYTTDLINGGVLNGVLVKGNTLTITVEVPAGQQGSASFTVNKIFAGNTVSSIQPKADFSVKADTTNVGQLAEENYSCAVNSTTVNANRSTVAILVTQSVSGASGQIQCTGSLVNDVLGDKKHTILTAAHCGTTDNWIGADVNVLWNRTSQCGVGLQDISSVDGQISSGYTTAAVVVQANDPSHAVSYDGDMWLLQNTSAPPLGSNPYWVGVNAVLYPNEDSNYGSGEIATGLTSVYNISHPLGSTKAYAFSNQPVLDGQGSTSPTNEFDGIDTYVVDFTQGTDDEGSSGSALYDQNNYLIGALSACGSNTLSKQFLCSFANIAENWLGQNGFPIENAAEKPVPQIPAGAFQTVKQVLDPTNTGKLVYAGLEDTTRTDNLTVFLNSDVVTASAGGTVNLSLFTSEAVSCTASSSPAVSGWNGALTVNNGNSVATALTIPSSSQYTLSVSCVNSANYTVTQDVVINSTGGSSSGGSSGGSSGSSSGGTSGGSSGGSSSGGSSSSSGSGNGSGGGGGAFDFLTLFPLLGMMLLRKKQA